MMSLFSKTLVLIIVIHIATMASSKPLEEMPERMGDSQPTYEYQLIVWPTDLDDYVDVIDDEPVQEVKPTVTIVEDPVVVMPSMDDEKDEEMETVPSVDNVEILQNYHKTYQNGSAEYMLVLSNGMVNYQRIDLKKIKSELKPVQEGYYTVPLEGNPTTFQTTYYHADEKGYHVYRTELSTRNPSVAIKYDDKVDIQ
ncbi:uncharacterized protein LOC142230335 [Haematobia irritans]|uniref:uncharacterized protein LOC142230335 n=1 Tax=Haematobia irritans TaxID=7368 RepID=UPI003F4FDC91